MSITCQLCQEKKPLYKCPVCGLAGHVDIETKTVVLHAQPLDPKLFRKGMQITVSFPSHFGCEFSKAIDKIDLKKLVQVGE